MFTLISKIKFIIISMLTIFTILFIVRLYNLVNNTKTIINNRYNKINKYIYNI